MHNDTETAVGFHRRRLGAPAPTFRQRRHVKLIFSDVPYIDWGWPMNETTRTNRQNARERVYSRLGDLNPNILGEISPPFLSKNPLWPAGNPKFRILHREGLHALITDGLSDPYEPVWHPEPKVPWNPELGISLEYFIETDESFPEPGPELVKHWTYRLIYYVSAYTADNPHAVLNALETFGMITLYCAPDNDYPELNKFVASNGVIGLFAGQEAPGMPGNLELGDSMPYFIPLKLLTPDEYDFATGKGNEGIGIAEYFKKNGSNHISGINRKSVLTQ